MEINILFDPSGRFVVDKSDDMGSFVAVGMLEMAKKLLLDPNKEEPVQNDIEGQLSVEDEPADEV